MQDSVIAELTEKKFIRVKLKGHPPKRYFFVNWVGIERALYEYKRERSIAAGWHYPKWEDIDSESSEDWDDTNEDDDEIDEECDIDSFGKW